MINNHKYYIKSYDGVTGNAPEFIIYSFNPVEGEPIWKEIVRWNFIPDWTPQTASQEIAKILVFL